MTDSLDDQLAQLQAIADQRQTLQPPPGRPFAPQPAVPLAATPPPASTPPKSLLDRAGDFLSGVGSSAVKLATSPSTYSGLAAGIVRAPGQLVGGTLDTAADAGKFVEDNMHSSFVRGLASAAAPIAGPVVAASMLARKAVGASLADTLSARATAGQVGNPGVNQFAAEAAGIAATLPMGGEGAAPEAAGVLSKVMAGAGKLLLNSAKVGAATAVVADPRSQRISNLIQNAGVHNAFIDYLAGDDSDPELIKRFKSGVEGALGNAALEPVFMGAGKAIKAAMGGDAQGAAAALSELPQVPEHAVVEATPLEATADHLDRTFATGRTQEARYQQVEWQAQEASGTPVQAASSRGASLPPEASTAPSESPGVTAGPSNGEAPPTAAPQAASSGPAAQESLVQGTRHTDAEAAGREPAPSAPVAPNEAATLPPGLAKATPRYGYGSKSFDVQFASDVDRAAYIVAGSGQSAAHGQYADFLNAAGFTPEEAVQRGQQIRTTLKGMAKEGDPEAGALQVPSHAPPPAVHPQAAAVATDANAVLAKAGAAERIDPANMAVASDGRIRVDPKTKAALDDQGLGRAFAATDQPISDRVLYKEVDAQGGSRVVGSLDRDGVQAFADRVADLRDAALDAKDPAVLDVRHAGPSGDVLQSADTAARSGEWKVANLGAPYDVAPTIRALIDHIPTTARPKSDADLMAQAKAVYDTVGIDPQTALQYASSLAGKTRDLDTALVVVRTLWTDAAKALDDLTGMDVSTFSPEAQADAAERIHHAMMLSLDMADTKAGIGRAQRVLQLPDLTTYLDNFGRTPADQLAPKGVGEMPPLPRNAEELQQWLDLWGAMKEDPVARQRYLQGLTFAPGKWSVLRNSLPNFFTASLVSAPSTFVRDLAGPATIGLLRTVERTAGGYAASLNPFIAQAARRDLLATASQAPAAYLRTLADVGDAFKYAMQAVGQGRGVLGGAGPLDFTAARVPQALMDAAMAKTGPGVTGDIPYVLGNLINAWPRAVHALHGGVNEFAQRLAYNGEIRAQAMLEAAQQGLTDPQDVRRFVLDKLDAAGDPLTGQATDPLALASSQRTTLTQRVGGGDTTRAFAKWVADAKTNTPELTYLLPIFRVPANAIGETIRRIPFVGQMLKETGTELSGSLGAPAQAEAYGRLLSGAALMTGGFVMARNGTLTGAGPSDPDARRLWLETHQPYSIRMGDKWVGYNRLDVIGQLLGIMGSTYDHTVYHAQDNGNAIFAGVGAFAQYFKDQAALQGVADLMSFGGNPNADQGYLARLTEGVASGFVPNFITQLGRNNADPNARMVHGETLDTGTEGGFIPALGGAVHSLADGAWQAILNKLPGGSALLDPQRNFLGEDVYKVQNAGFNTLPISLSNVNTYARDPVMDELSRLYEQTGYAPGTPPVAAGKGHFDQRDVTLEDGHSLQDSLLRHRMTVEIDGQTLRQALQSAITSDDYAQAVDGTGRRETDDGQTTRAGILSKIFTDYGKVAKQATAAESPVAARWLAVADAKDQDNPVLRPYSAQTLATQPALLKALNIPIEDHEDKVRGGYEPAL